MLFLSAQDVWRSLPMGAAIDAMHEALTAVAAGRVDMPVRTQLAIDGHDGTLLVMPALAQRPCGESLAVKVVSVCGQNPARGKPAINAVVVALDPQTGVPVALLEGGALTAIRTAAASGAATRALARPDAQTLAILGAGVQAHSHALAMCVVRDIREIRIYARKRTHAEGLAKRLSARDGWECEMHVTTSADDAVSGADLICTTTPAKHPLFAAASVSPGTHINAVGSFQPDMQEVPDACVAGARVFVDHLESALAEAGDLLGPIERGIISPAHIVGEVGAMLVGGANGRLARDDVTLFKSVGNAVQDAIAASVALESARQQSLGQTLHL